MYFGEMISEVIDRLSLDRENLTLRSRVGVKVNLIYKEIAHNAGVDWRSLLRSGEIRTETNYNTGTCSITEDGYLVSFVGATLTKSMEGNLFQPSSSKNWYQIRYVDVSGSQITLRKPIIESSSTGLTFNIWRRYYFFPSDMRKLNEFERFGSDGILRERSSDQLHQNNTDLTLTGDVVEYALFGDNAFQSDYTTGTVSLTKDSNLMTGVGAGWLGNLDCGDKVKVGDDVYHVKQTQTDNQVLLLNYAKVDIPAGTAYRATKENQVGVQLWYNPNSEVILPYSYIKKVFNLVNEDYDRTELDDELFDIAILDGAEASLMAVKKDSDWLAKTQVYQGRVRDLKSSRFASSPLTRQMRPLIKNRRGYC